MASVRTARGLRLHRVTQGASDGGEYSPARLPSLIDRCVHVSSSVCLQSVNSTSKQSLIKRCPHLEDRSWEELKWLNTPLSWVVETHPANTCHFCPHLYSLSLAERNATEGV